MKSPRRNKAFAAVGLIAASLGAVAGASGVKAVSEVQAEAPQDAELPVGQRIAPATANSSLADMVEAVGPAVVQIEVRGGQGRGLGPPAESFPFGLEIPGFGREALPPSPGRAALGSGFVVDPRGIIVTNNHVVDGANAVTVKFSDGRELAGQVLGRDPKTDLAVVRVEGNGRFKAIPWGDSDRLRVGDAVFAVGSPFGLGNTVTSGILSARGREIGAGPYDDFLQVDAAINTGNSGGPLFNAAGQVIGVNTAIFSPSGGNVGIGFAIPSRMARSVVRQIVADGHVSRGRIGVALGNLTTQTARSLGLGEARGALIVDVEPGGPAAGAGLRAGDVVTSFGGRPIEDGRALARAVAEVRVRSAVPAVVVRDGRPQNVTLTVVPTRQG